MDLRYLQSFVTVIELGSLAEAARQLDLTPAAIAARIHALEAEVGTTLVKRAGRSVKATESGEKIVERARSILRDVRDLQAVASDGVSLGEFRLGVFTSAMTSALPPLLKTIYADHPQLNVFVAPGSSVGLCRDVASGALDAAIVVEPQFAIGKSCEWMCLIEEPLVVVAPAALAHADPHELLRTQPFIRYDRSVLGGQLADRYLRDQGIRPQQRLEIDSLLVAAGLVGHGLGVALLPDWAPMWVGNPAIARIPLPNRAPVRRVGMIWARHGPRASLATVFLEAAQAMFNAPAEQARPASGFQN